MAELYAWFGTPWSPANSGSGSRGRKSRPAQERRAASGQLLPRGHYEDKVMPTMGALRGVPPWEPSKVALP